MVVTDDALVAGRDLVELARALERGGATALQLRLKAAPARALAEAARAVLAQVRLPVLLNDRPDVAIAVGAAGVHLGPDDLAPRLARRIAPEGFVIGASVTGPSDLPALEGADYAGIGPVFPTFSKADAAPVLGAARFAELVSSTSADR